MTAGFAGTSRIGPNAVIRTLEALRERAGATATTALLRTAGLERYADEVPATMVPEDDVIALYGAMRAQLGVREADANARVAGFKTADYLLAHRIPRPAQAVMRLLPPIMAAPLLLAAITRHTWTFAGSGTVRVMNGCPATIAIERCPICRSATSDAPLCAYYAATFERLFRVLVGARSSVVEVACEAMGASRCIFELRF